MTKQKVAILGGGMGALASAWHITQASDWHDRFELTVYQMGWRLGGKCATGRGPNRRIEEHGIHLFGGGYYNALGMMRDVYRAVYGPPGDVRFDQAFQRQFTSVRVVGDRPTAFRFPESSVTIDDLPNVASLAAMLASTIKVLRKLIAPTPLATPFNATLKYISGATKPLAGDHLDAALKDVDLLADQIQQGSPGLTSTLGRLEALAAPELKGITLPALIHAIPGLPAPPGVTSMLALAVPQWLGIVNFIYALTKGWVSDLAGDHDALSDLDAQPYDTWLRKHGAWASTIELDIVQTPLRILYQYRGGTPAPDTRSIGAGGYFHWTVRSLAYVQSPFWFFEDGTGDTVVKPLYLALKARGVRFEFFRKIERLTLADDGKHVDEVELRVQATTKHGGAYEPLLHGFWPSTPLLDQLSQGDVIGALPPDELESYWSGFRSTETATLRRGKDFDQVVLAISLGALPLLCRRLLDAEPAWREMVSAVRTVETESLQIWMNRTSEDLGMVLNPPIDKDDTGLGCGFASPYDAFSDFTAAIDRERWPDDRKPKSLWYFSDVVPTPARSPDLSDEGYPQRRHAEAKARAKRFLTEQLGRLLSEFRFDSLVPQQPGGPMPQDALLDEQWIRANVQPSERYVQALAGTTAQRLDAGRSAHFSNLLLAGDWTYNGLNVGCVEATVMSGMLVANDLLGRDHADGVLAYFGRQPVAPTPPAADDGSL